MIPWGCDYMYQNAALMYESTDKLIDTINAHTDTWGVHAQYATPSEYLSAVRKSNATFPVKPAGSNFFPFTSWSGYFTSRPKLKGLNTQTHAALNAAEQLFALSATAAGDRDGLWAQLESARRDAGVVQHHDAITGTMCKASEGCAGTDQVVGAHDVLNDYEGMLRNATANARRVAASVLSAQHAHSVTGALSVDVGAGLGDTLMGQGDGGQDAVIVVYNPLATQRTEMVVVQVPVCAVTVTPITSTAADGAAPPIPSQVTAEFSISAGQAPFYDFELSFEATVPPLASVSFRVSPSADATCGGGDLRATAAAVRTEHFVRHSSVFGAREEEACTAVPQGDGTPGFQARVVARARDLQSASGNLDAWVENLAAAREEELSACDDDANDNPIHNNNLVTLENSFLRVVVDAKRGLQSITDKTLQKTVDVHHELFRYGSSGSDAYAFNPSGPASPVMPGGAASVLAATVALGPVMQEIWLQISAQHKTRIRLWVSEDPAVGRRLELAHRIGVLEPLQDLVSRFTVPALQGIQGVTFVSEDNGYEKVEHEPGTGGNIAEHHYPSQASAFIRGPVTGGAESAEDEPLQLSVALDRSHAVGSMIGGTLDVIQHRRGLPYLGSGGTVVLDDTDRIFTHTWISVGGATQANRDRVSMKLRLNHPLQLFFGVAAANKTRNGDGTGGAAASALRHRSLLARVDRAGVSAALPTNLHLQSVRSVGAPSIAQGGGVLVRIRHMFAAGEDKELSAPSEVDVLALFGGAAAKATEVTLTGILPRSELKRHRFPVDGEDQDAAQLLHHTQKERTEITTSVSAFELRTFLVTK